MRIFKTIRNVIIMCFITLKHGINPFRKLNDIKYLLCQKLSEKEKRIIISIASGYNDFSGKYFKTILYKKE